jgi:thymidylate kinase
VKIVSFSGIDGAGKSTQILALQEWLSKSGLRTGLLTFWDDVVVLSRSREFLSHKAFKGDSGVGTPQRPVTRRDKNVSSWPLTLVRFGLYFADAVHLALTVREAKRSEAEVVLFDRYIYDELANLPLRQTFARIFAQLVLKFVPSPDLALVIDADPVAAEARKPEYPLDFVRQNREAYLDVARLSGRITVIEPGSIEAMKASITHEMLQVLAASDRKRQDSLTAAAHRANISPGELIEP